MEARLRAKLDELKTAYDSTVAQLSDPEVHADQNRFREVSIRHSELKQVVDAYERFDDASRELAEAQQLAEMEADPEAKEYFETVAKEQQQETEQLDAELRRMLVPKDPNDEKDVIVELRAAVGGDEAALWAADLFRMYSRLAERRGWSTEAMDTSITDGGGIKEATFAVKGRGAYSLFKFEAGPHRVQRVPKTESQGRIHTSIATVAVLPEAEDVEIDLHDNDLEIETFRSTGPGGQSVNTTDSAVRIRHVPTGIVVSCQDEKSQLQNKLKAMRVLRARLYQAQMAEQLGERASARRSQVGSGERAEKIRTYNFKENRVTDHRISRTLHSLTDILDGDLDAFHQELSAREVTERLAEVE
jgi:peptide chain release factor 1